jgi:endonuclease G
MNRLSLSVVATGLALLAGQASAATSQCPEHFAGGQAPDIVRSALSAKTTPLCYSGFAVLHSGVSRTPLYSAEHLTRERIEQAAELSRENPFHAEKDRLSADERAELSDYAGSSKIDNGYDRGHMSPNKDMPTKQAQWESFTLANMIPQDSDNNENLWEGIESAVRTLVRKEDEAYIVTVPMFLVQPAHYLRRVMIPSHIAKVVYLPKRGVASAYLVENKPGMDYKVISVADLEQMAGISLLPSVSPQVKTAKVDLPVPTPHGMGDHKSGGHGDARAKDESGGAVMGALRKFLR